LLVIVLLGVSGFYAYTNYWNPSQEESNEPEMQTAVARRGDLVIFASGTGQVTPASEIGLGFDDSGTLIELNVAVGDKVNAGDLLARLQTKNTQAEIDAAISEAQLSVVTAQDAIDELYDNAEIERTTALNDIATYAQAVRDAQYQLENYTIPTYLQGMNAVEALDKMKAGLDAASAAFAPYKFLSEGNDTREKLLEVLNEAQSNYDAAVKRLNYEYELEVAQANLEKARAAYAEVENGPSHDELNLAQAELANAEARLELAKEDQAVLELVAPSEGTVLAVEANVGEVVSAASIITLADLNQPQLEVYMDETDLDKVAVDYAAEVIFDAFPDKIFTGMVVAVNPSLETVSNVQAVKVIVLLDQESLEPGLSLPVGLNASVDVIAGRAVNAVLVPVEALRDLGEGEYAVFVVVDGEPVLRVVEVGLVDITSAEILSGLEAGEVVSTGITQTR